MQCSLRHGAAITIASVMLIGTAAADSGNLGWTWSQPLTLPSERDAAYFSSSSVSSHSSFSSSYGYSYSRSSYAPYTFSSVISSASSSSVAASSFAPDDPSRPLTWADLQLYHEQVVRPLQEMLLLQTPVPFALPDAGTPLRGPACDTSMKGQTRDAPDGCNSCICTDKGWTCTQYSCRDNTPAPHACAANSDCGSGETCVVSGNCNRRCADGMQACGPSVCGGVCTDTGIPAPRCGNGTCDPGEANFCQTPASGLCLQGTCPGDCASAVFLAS